MLTNEIGDSMGSNPGSNEIPDPNKIHTTWFGFVLVIVAVVLTVLLSLARIGPFVTIQLKEGISVFAVAYLMAQFIERAIEPFSEMKLQPKESKDTTDKTNYRALFSDTDKIRSLRVDITEPQDAKAKEKKQKALEKLEKKRSIAMWGLASLLGILLSYSTVGLFEIVGVNFQSLAVGGSAITGHTVDAILSGMIVGGGTKGLHDLIGYFEKEKNTKS
jgi:hypothetical protein